MMTFLDNFERQFSNNSFGIGINKHWIRWYKGRSRDRWQLTRDLTVEEMGNDQKSTEAAVEESLEQGSLERVWKVRNFKKRKWERENVVDEIDKYRKGVEDDAPISTVASKKLQKDYVTTDEAVKIINDHREKNFEEERIPYKKYDPYMEWEAIEKDAVRMEKTKRRLHGGIT
ncbi:unnamed protein product [Rhizophagus irregularis]|nr:unnamed protein product [Rhizophagus irregularis]